ncbi:MAG: hypothetical protein ACI8UO_005039 [Verrucomicrobiales bacterium]|jgi:hypothetical protein
MKREFLVFGALSVFAILALSGCGEEVGENSESTSPKAPDDLSTTGTPVRDLIDPFEGGDLTDWTMESGLWTAKDGVIIGKTDGEIPHNQFLIWNGRDLKDFELTCELRLIGDNNSGIQYRSQVLTDVGFDVMKGYQCDVHPNPPYTGMLYDERGRGILATRVQKVAITEEGKKILLEDHGEPPAIDVSSWNTYMIRAEGNHLQHKINGQLAVDVIDLQESERELTGKIGFQVHQGKPMEIHIRNIRIEELPEGKILTLGDLEIPADG